MICGLLKEPLNYKYIALHHLYIYISYNMFMRISAYNIVLAKNDHSGPKTMANHQSPQTNGRPEYSLKAVFTP